MSPEKLKSNMRDIQRKFQALAMAWKWGARGDRQGRSLGRGT